MNRFFGRRGAGLTNQPPGLDVGIPLGGNLEVFADIPSPGLSQNSSFSNEQQIMGLLKVGNFLVGVNCLGSGGHGAYNLYTGAVVRLPYGGINSGTWAWDAWESQGQVVRAFQSTVGPPYSQAIALYDPATNVSTNKLGGGPDGVNAGYLDQTISVDETTGLLYFASQSVSPSGANAFSGDGKISTIQMSVSGAWGAWGFLVNTGLFQQKYCFCQDSTYLYFITHNYTTDNDLYIYRVNKSTGVVELLRRFIGAFSSGLFWNGTNGGRQPREISFIHLGKGDFIVSRHGGYGLTKYSATTGLITDITTKGAIAYAGGGLYGDASGNYLYTHAAYGASGWDFSGRVWMLNGLS